LAQSRDRVAKERAIRRRQLKRLWARLKRLSTMQLTREELLMKLGAARDQSRTAWRLVVIEVAADCATFSYRLDRAKLRQTRSREGRYLLRTNLVEEDPAKLWSHYLLLVAVEEAFKNLKSLPLRKQGAISRSGTPMRVVLVGIAFLAVCFVVNLVYQILHKPTEVFALIPGESNKAPIETWRQYAPLFREYSTTSISPELLAALAQVESAGNPIARTYWRWSLTSDPFAVYQPASSAVGMYQMTDAALAEVQG
jgi:Transglycosylase SLT domain